MKVFSKKTLCLGGIITFAFIGGILLQKRFPVGRMLLFSGLKKYETVTDHAAQFNWNNYFGKVNHSWQWINSPATPGEKSPLTPIPDTSKKRLNKLLNELLMARKKSEFSEFEMLHGKFFNASAIGFLTREQRDITVFEEDEIYLSKIAAVTGFADYLSNRGVHLIFCPVPSSLEHSIVAQNDDLKNSDLSPLHSKFLHSLEKLGIDCIDLRPKFREFATKGIPLFNQFDHHLNPQGVDVASNVIAEKLIGGLKTTLGELPYIPFETEWKITTAPVDNTLFDKNIVSGSQFYKIVKVGDQNYVDFPDSAIALYGDSMLFSGANFNRGLRGDLAAHLSSKIGYPCGLFARSAGGGDVPAIYLQYTQGRAAPKIVLWISDITKVEYKIPAKMRDGGINRLPPPPVLAGINSATVISASVIPTPESSPYPDALYSILVNVNNSSEETAHAIIYAPAFISRKLLPEYQVTKGSTISGTFTPWNAAVKNTPSLATLRIIDDTDIINAPIYYWNKVTIQE